MTNTAHIVAAGTRGTWLPEHERAIVVEAEDPATTASEVARRYGLHSSRLFRWRRTLRTEASPPPMASRPSFVPLALPAPQPPVRDEPPRPGAIEIELAGGHRLRAEASADVVLLRV